MDYFKKMGKINKKKKKKNKNLSRGPPGNGVLFQARPGEKFQPGKRL